MEVKVVEPEEALQMQISECHRPVYRPVFAMATGMLCIMIVFCEMVAALRRSFTYSCFIIHVPTAIHLRDDTYIRLHRRIKTQRHSRCWIGGTILPWSLDHHRAAPDIRAKNTTFRDHGGQWITS